MSVSYRWVQWNTHKKIYDLILISLCVLFLISYVSVSSIVYSGERAISPMILAIRGFGVLSIILLHVILCVGPLSRITNMFSPVLYNRRHLGVTMFIAAFLHGGLTILFYGAFGVRSPLLGVLDGYQGYNTISGFPFEMMGFLGLLILFAMASTSHDFWLSFLTPRVWKSLHMSVYLGYGFILIHVIFGALQSEPHPLYAILVISGLLVVSVLHLISGFREHDLDKSGSSPIDDWVDIGTVHDFPLNKGRVICVTDQERVAIYRHENGISAMSNVCAHQGGPLGEGQIVNGCVTCPWHGYQYLPENGQSPPPYTEKIPTYELRIEGERVLLNSIPHDPGTHVPPIQCANAQAKKIQRSETES